MRQFLITLAWCGLFYGLASLGVVTWWPLLSPLTTGVPAWMPEIFSLLSVLAVFWVITHQQRGCFDYLKLPMLLLYGVTMFFYLVSTLHPSQFNLGVATLELAFFVNASYTLARRLRDGQRSLRDGVNFHPRELLATTFVWVMCLGTACAFVLLIWQRLTPLASHWPPEAASMVAASAGFASFATIVHAMRGQANTYSLPYRFTLIAVNLAVAVSTLHPSQYNLGAAVIAFGFVIMYGWLIATGRKTLRTATA